MLQYLGSNQVQLNTIDAEEPEVPDYHYIPKTATLASELRVCLQEGGDDVPRDFTKLFDQKLFRLDLSAVPSAVRAYKALRVEHEPLHLIPPNFESPLPPLNPAVG